MEEGIIIAKPKFPNYVKVQKRLDSFKAWPSYLPVTPEVLVESGLVFTGVGDSVRCFYCGGGLKNFEDGDNPDIDHIKWYPKCPFMNLKFDRKYILKVKSGENSQGKVIEKRHEDPMTHVTVLSCIQCGFDEKLVRMTIKLFYEEYYHLEFDSDTFVEILLNLEEDIDNGKTSICDQDLSLPYNTSETVTPAQESQPYSCKICFDDVSNLIILLPCRHRETCFMCCVCFDICPICRAPIKGMIRPQLE